MRLVHMCFEHYYDTTNVKNMHLHRDSNPGPWSQLSEWNREFNKDSIKFHFNTKTM